MNESARLLWDCSQSGDFVLVGCVCIIARAISVYVQPVAAQTNERVTINAHRVKNAVEQTHICRI